MNNENSTMSDELKQYHEFMENPENIMHCTECPERLSGSCEVGLPCGQQNCWVELHCK